MTIATEYSKVKTMAASFSVSKVTALPDYQIRVEFTDGEIGIVDMSNDVRRGGRFKAMQDNAFFNQVATILDGMAVAWPGDMCILDLGTLKREMKKTT